MVVVQEFPARPSALPDVRDFVRRQLTTTPLSDEDIRTLCERVADVLLDAAGDEREPSRCRCGSSRSTAEVDVLFAPDRSLRPRRPVSAAAVSASDRRVDGNGGSRTRPGRAGLEPRRPVPDRADGVPSFAAWFVRRAPEPRA